MVMIIPLHVLLLDPVDGICKGPAVRMLDVKTRASRPVLTKLNLLLRKTATKAQDRQVGDRADLPYSGHCRDVKSW